MAIMVNPPPQTDWTQALTSLAQGFGGQYGQQQQRQRQQQEGEILNQVLSQIAQKGQNASAFDVIQGLARAQSQGVPLNTIQAYGEQIPKLMQSTARSQGLDPQLLAAQAEMRKAQSEEHKQAYQFNEPIIKSIQEKRLSAPRISTELENAKEAILSGNIGWWSPSHVAEIFHMPSLLTPEGKLAKNAMKSQYAKVKQYFGGNPSDFETKQIDDMLVKIGADENANMVAYAMLKAENDMDNLSIQATDKIIRESNGQIPFNFGERLSQEMDKGRDQIKENTRQIINYAASKYYSPEKETKKLGYNSALINKQDEGIQGEQKEILGRKQNENPRKVRYKKTGKVKEVSPELHEYVSQYPNEFEFVE